MKKSGEGGANLAVGIPGCIWILVEDPRSNRMETGEFALEMKSAIHGVDPVTLAASDQIHLHVVQTSFKEFVVMDTTDRIKLVAGSQTPRIA
jgi:hypothetical protein